jgi:dolichol-phosphate mannosyltransferase
MLKKMWKKQIIRYLICGAITAIFNVFLISSIIEILNLNTSLTRNIANVISIEISLLFSFWVYRVWVWSDACKKTRTIFLYQIPLYHISAGVSVLTRSFILFPLMDWIGVHYAINTLIGIVAGAVLNYVLSDRIVFRTKRT